MPEPAAHEVHVEVRLQTQEALRQRQAGEPPPATARLRDKRHVPDVLVPQDARDLSGQVVAGQLLQDRIQIERDREDNSFPSDHATVASAMAVSATLSWRKWAVPLLALAFLIGFARVLAGIHYPGDVLVGWTVGAVTAMAAWVAVSVGARWRGWQVEF